MATRFLTILTGRNLPKIRQSRESEPSTINEKTIADFKRVVEQTGILEHDPLADKARRAFLCLAALSLSSCAGMPHWMGGLPEDAPPRPGTPEYDAWMAKRAEEAARPKTQQQQPK
jgi:hypothetical protein